MLKSLIYNGKLFAYNLHVWMSAKCVPLCEDLLDCSPPGSSVHGILQERILEWIAILFSNTVVMRYNNVNYLIPAAAAAKSLQSCPIEVRSV